MKWKLSFQPCIDNRKQITCEHSMRAKLMWPAKINKSFMKKERISQTIRKYRSFRKWIYATQMLSSKLKVFPKQLVFRNDFILRERQCAKYIESVFLQQAPFRTVHTSTPVHVDFPCKIYQHYVSWFTNRASILCDTYEVFFPLKLWNPEEMTAQGTKLEKVCQWVICNI